MVFNATFNNISAVSWQSVLLVEETGGVVIGTDCTCLCKSNYHMITTRTAYGKTENRCQNSVELVGLNIVSFHA